MKIQNKYFNLKEYLDKLTINPLEDIVLLIFTAVRNMGKSYGTWDYIEKEIWEKFNYTKKIVYVRTNTEKLKKAKNAFKASYIGKYDVIGDVIYKIEYDEKGKEIFDKRVEIGRFVDIENEHNYRSGAGKVNYTNYMLAFWDEFNEDTQINKDLFNKFLMLYSTIKRQNKPFLFVVIGNKINANNDIFIKLQLDTQNHDFNKDYIQKIYSPKSKHFIGYYVDIGFDTFKHLNDDDDIVRNLAEFDYNTDSIFNEGKFLKGQSYNVIIYEQYVKPTKKIKNYFSFQEKYIEYGTFGLEDEFIYFHEIIENEVDYEKYKVIALDMMGLLSSKKSIKKFDNTEYVDMVDLWSYKIKNRLLYFTSFALKIEIEKYIKVYASIWDD